MPGHQTKVSLFRRILIFGFLASGIQLLIYSVVLLLLLFLGVLFGKPDFISAYGLHLSIIIFGIILITQNLLTTIINRSWFTWTAIALTLYIYFIGWGEDINSWPVKTVIYLIMGTVIVLGKFYIDRKLADYFTTTARTANSG